MRITLPALLIVLTPALAGAQGRIIPRPCGPPMPPPCTREACPNPRPMIVPNCGARIERVSNSVNVTLVDRVLRYEVTEVFHNFGGVVAEADYIFPLPQTAAFEDLKLSINGELVSGETMPADKARAVYEEIVRRQRDPALVEWIGSGVLRTRIFPIAAGEEKTVVIRYQSIATREGDALRIDYRRAAEPLANGGSFMTVRNSERTASPEGDGVLASRFTLRYPRTEAFGEPYSPTHSLRTRDDGRNRVVEARGSGAEVTLLLPMRRSNSASISVLSHAVDDQPGFALITLSPPAEAPRSTPRDVTFVVDVSGSMSGRKLEQAKAAGHALLQTLTESDRFRIIDFSTDVREFRENSWTTATEGNLRAANRYLNELRAEGSTNISGALSVALESPASGSNPRLPLVVFVTDGEPTVGERNADAIAALASRKRGNARVFAVGVSSGINATLIEQLALQGRGTAHFVRDDESVEATVSLLASRLTAPVLTDVRITATGVRLSRVLPAGPIDVFAGQDLVVLARYDGEGDTQIRFEGQSPTGPQTWSTRVQLPKRERGNPFVARLWAAQRIGWLAAEKRRNGGAHELNDEIRTLGERYGIPTEYSSYLVLEPGMSADMMPRPQAAQGRGARQSGAVGNTAGSSFALPPATPPAQQNFEAARAAADQRSAKSVASLEVGLQSAGMNERVAGSRRFRLVDSTWTDQQFAKGTRVIRVKPYSALYFELLQRLTDLAQPFALGNRVLVSGKSVAILLDDAGLDTLDEQAVQRLLRDW